MTTFVDLLSNAKGSTGAGIFDTETANPVFRTAGRFSGLAGRSVRGGLDCE